MSSEFAIAKVLPGKLNALVKNIMRQTGVVDPNEAVRLLNSGEYVLCRSTLKWHEEDGVIYFSVTSDGSTGEDWIRRLESKGFYVRDSAKHLLRSPDFRPTNGMTISVAVLKGMLLEDSSRITKNILAEADKRKFSRPNAELACLIREKFTDEEIDDMDLCYIVATHEPINDSYGNPSLLCADQYGECRQLSEYDGRPGSRFDCDAGFAFALSQQVSSQS